MNTTGAILAMWQPNRKASRLAQRESPDHAIGAQQELARNLDARPFRRTPVDDQLVARRLLDRQGGRLRALEHPRDEVRGAAAAGLPTTAAARLPMISRRRFIMRPDGATPSRPQGQAAGARLQRATEVTA